MAILPSIFDLMRSLHDRPPKAFLRSIGRLSSDNASQTEQISASVQQQAAASEEITASAEVLAKQAEELQELLQKFKV